MEPSPTDDLAITRYLLGDLALEEQERLEERLLTDGGFYDLLLIGEDELTDEYVLGTLPPDDKKRFEGHFLSAPERRRKLSFARALRSCASSAVVMAVPLLPHDAKERRRQFRVGFLPARHPRLGLYVAAALLLLLVAGGWWSASRMGRLKDQAQVLVGLLESARAENVRLTTALRDRAKLEQGSPVIVAFRLAPGLLRSGGETEGLVIPPDTSLVELQLELANVEPESYRAVLQDASGDEIWSQSKLRALSSGSRLFVNLTLPSTLLVRGDYEVKLGRVPRSGAPKPVGRYYFRVVSR